MANVPINSLTAETVLAVNSRFELQRNPAQGGESRSATLDEMLLKSGPYIDERQSAVNLLDWSDIDGSDGSTDVSASVQAWQDTARATGRVAIAPARILGLATAISIKAPTIGTGGRTGYGTGDATQFSTTFKNIGINNPVTPMLLIDNTSDFYNRSMVKGIVIDGNYLAATRQCLGLYANGELGVGSVEMFQFEDIFALRCFTGLRIFGWTGLLRNCSASANREFGLNLIMSNAVTVQGGRLNAGVSGAWGARVQGANAGGVGSANAVKFIGVTFQSDLNASNGLDVTEEIHDCSVDSCYFEKHSGGVSGADHTANDFPTANTFHIRVGVRSRDGGVRTVDGTSAERAAWNFGIDNCLFTGGSGETSAYKGRRVYFGNVQGVKLNADFQNARLEVSDECLDISGAVTGQVDSVLNGDGSYLKSYNYGHVAIDSTGSMGRAARSFIPNPNNHGAASGKVRGYQLSYRHTSITIANETTVTRDGIQSLKIIRAGDSTTSVGRGWYARPYGQHALGLNNKTVFFTGWMYIPNMGQYVANTGGPSFGFYSNGNIYAYALGSAGMPYIRVDRWFRFCVWHKLTSAGGYWGPYIAPLSYGSNPGAVDHHVFVSDLALFVNPPSFTDIMAGRYSFAGEAGRIEGSAFVADDSAAPTSTELHHEVGDKVYNSAPAAGGNVGWVCTTAGAPGTWKQFGAIEA